MANGTAALPTDQPCSFQAPFALRVPTYPQDVLNLDGQEIKKSKCEKDGVVEWTGRENKMEVCIIFFTLLKRESNRNAFISENCQDQCTFYVLIFVNISIHKF